MAGHIFNPEHADKLLDPKRIELLPPEKIIDELTLRSDDIVADLGAGNGYFTLPLAKNTSQTVYAVDIEPKMLELLKKRAKKDGIENIKYVTSNLEEIYLPSNSINKALLAFVIHEVPHMDKALNEIKRILKPGGKALILEWEAIEMDMGPPLHERIPSNKLRDFIQDQGFNVTLSYLSEANYALSITPA
jgi:ubiquinone/menaquinone biosynthesis C-methylase UbiE